MKEAYEAVIGLEIHAELKTRTKAFCACENRSGAEPNTLVCPVCGGMPGAMPYLNRQAVILSARAGLALGCRVNPVSAFDRKHYLYPDLPKGYQITQYFHPLCEAGEVTVRLRGQEKQVGITRIHMEEDAGKLVHTPEGSALDLNRCGVPLIEIVTEPDIRSAEEASAVFRRIRELLVFAGVTEGRMNEGHLRCDVNLSLHHPGEPFGTRTETKNLNSFSAVERAVKAEIARQTALLEAGEKVEQMTLRLASEGTVPMRPKEKPEDYGYYPEPDLPPLMLTEEELSTIAAAMPELPESRRARYLSLGVSPADADLLSASRECAEAFEAALSACGESRAPALSRLFTGEVFARAWEGAASADEPLSLPFPPEKLAAPAALLTDGRINATTAKALVNRLFDLPPAEAAAFDPEAHCRENGLLLITDEAAIRELAVRTLRENPDLTAAYRAGKTKVLGALQGKAMALCRGAADGRLLRTALEEALAE